MPFELSIFFGAKYFGNKNQRNKSAVILDKGRYRYQQFISDLNGVDIKAHNDEVNIAIRKVRDWLATSSRRRTIPGHAIIQSQFQYFTGKLPAIAENSGFEIDEISYNDFLCDR